MAKRLEVREKRIKQISEAIEAGAKDVNEIRSFSAFTEKNRAVRS